MTPEYRDGRLRCKGGGLVDRGHISVPPEVIFGRDGELKALAAFAQGACRGQAGCVVLTAPAGLGRSRLLDALADHAHGLGMTVLRGRCTPGGTGYAGLRALTTAPGPATAPADAPHALPAPEAAGPFALAAAYPVLHGLYRHAVGLMSRGPLLITLDDAEHCDEHSLRWLDFLLRRALGQPLLIALGRRFGAEPAGGGAWTDLATQPATTAMCLAPLSGEAIGELVRHRFGGRVEPSVAARVAAVCGGNPRTAIRVVTELRSQGAGPDGGGGRRADELGGRLLGRSVSALLADRPHWARAVAEAVAVIGADCTEQVAALAGVSAPRAQEGVAMLRCAGALDPDGPGVLHPAVRAAVLEPLGAVRLAALHTRAALLHSDAGRPAAQVARHLLLVPGTPRPWMVPVLRAAAAEAEQRGAFTLVADCLRRVLEADPADGGARLRLALALAQADPVSAVPEFRAALAGARDAASSAAVAVQYAVACLTVPLAPACRTELLDALTGAREALGPEQDVDGRLRRQLDCALLIVGRGPAAVARVTDRPAAPTVHRSGPPVAPWEHALGALRIALSGHSSETAVAAARRVLAVTGQRGRGGWPLIAAGVALVLADETTDAAKALDLVVRSTQDEPASWTGALALAGRALLLRRCGALDEAITAARSAIEAVGATDAPGADARLVTPRLVLAATLVDRGETRQAEGLLARVGGSVALDGAGLERQLYLFTHARIRQAAGDADAALRALRECGSAQRASGVVNPVFLPWWVETCLLLGERRHGTAGRELAEQGGELARRWGTPRALGLAALAAGAVTPGPEGIDLLARSVQLLLVSPARAEHARAEYVLGQALLCAGDLPGAREHLREAVGLAGGCGAFALAGAARLQLIRCGGRMPEITASRADLLTGAEQKVAELAASGTSNRQIARHLFVTVRTVESHLTSAYRKLGVGRREALAEALRDPGWSLVEAG
ncbi:AAA family ATPase [Kitasatospora sp. NPDC049258]|uniref:AAA family ATPase n=1 Tax=Kitasatospora sp. NPDC049258 TaxID=3155394 RepID=UPI00341F9225